ncbi:MAG: UvrD-helicase domain-containing protein [Fimbriimonadales bacterium]|nr:UvrD-helicase domain-containing protein [Fimbriimonadales bacterium]
MPSPLPDQAARDALVRDLDRSFFVKAGAGTGKTTALVARVLAVVQAGGSLERLVAITFTKKAAAEMKGRLRSELLRLVHEGPDGEARERSLRALAEVDAAPIQTIHSFAQSLLASHPIEAGLPPILTVEEEAAFGEQFERWWLATSERLLARPDLADAWRALLASRVSLHDVGWLARFCLSNYRPEMDRRLAPPSLQEARDEFEPMARAFVDEWDRVKGSLKGRYPDVERSMRELEALASLDPGSPEPPPKWKPPKPRSLTHDIRKLWSLQETYAARRDAVAKLWGGVRGAWLWDRFFPIARAVLEEAERWREARLRQGRLTFQDLLFEAVRLLRGNAEVLAKVRAAYDRLFVDEFQDTDPQQVELIALIAGRLGPDATWQENLRSAPPGRVLLVGDAKQSIYAFRGAEVGMFQRVQAEFPPEDVLELTTNFRIAASTLDWINEVFPRVFAGPDLDASELGSGLPIPYEPIECGRVETRGRSERLVCVREPTEGETDVCYPALGVRLTADKPSARHRRRAEARWAARCIQEAVSEGHEVWPKGCPPRPVRYGDFAVLIPTRTIEPVLLRELDAHGVPYRVESQTAMFDSQEFRDLILLLRAIDDPTDQVALVGALKGPAFGLTNEELREFAAERHDPWRTPPPGEGGPVGEAMRELDAFRREVRGLDAAEVLSRAVERFEWISALARNPRPRESWNRLWTLLAMAREFSAGGQGALRSFIGHLEGQAEERARVSEPVGAELDDDAVRILTVHAAKGLEFPAVVMVGFGATPQPPRDRFLWDDRGWLQASLGSQLRSPGFEEARGAREAVDRLERQRLLYVAATRTMGPLSLGLLFPEDKGSMAERLHAAARDAQRLPSQHLPPRLPAPARATKEWADEDREAASRRFAEIREKATRPVLASPTAISKAMLGEGPRTSEGDFPEEPFVWADRRAKEASAEGLALHAVFEAYRPDCDLPTLAREACEAEGVPDPSEVLRMVQNGLRLPSVRQALDGHAEVWREAFVSAWIEGWLVEGYMDLLVRHPDGALTVLDFKTDRADSPERIERSMRHHRIQGACYALMVERTIGRRPGRVAFCFLRPERPFEREIEDLEAAMEEVRKFLRSWDGSVAAREWTE